MGEQGSVAVIGAGVIGCAIAWSLAREGFPVLLADPAEPGMGGASFGNAGHLGAELVEPLPSPALLFGFWRELFAFGGVLDIPWRRLPQFAPWARRFAAAAFRRRENTERFAPLVRPGTPRARRAAWPLSVSRPPPRRRSSSARWPAPRTPKRSQA
jgi:D-amino-acid dehydrogenase